MFFQFVTHNSCFRCYVALSYGTVALLLLCMFWYIVECIPDVFCCFLLFRRLKLWIGSNSHKINFQSKRRSYFSVLFCFVFCSFILRSISRDLNWKQIETRKNQIWRNTYNNEIYEIKICAFHSMTKDYCFFC